MVAWSSTAATTGFVRGHRAPVTTNNRFLALWVLSFVEKVFWDVLGVGSVLTTKHASG
jgi:hypothetical protein